MQNPNHIRYSENPGEEDKFHNEGLISFIDNDYVLNFLNDPESAQRRSMPMQQNTFNAMIPEMQLSFPNFQDNSKNQEHFPNIYSKINVNDAWFLQNMGEANKLHPGMNRSMNFKIENNQEIDGSLKTKKIKLDKEQTVRKAVDVTSSRLNKNNIKNTYINKINSLITDQKVDMKSEESKPEVVAKGGDIRKGVLVKNEVENPNNPALKNGMKKVRSYDVLKSDEIEKLNVKLARNRESARNSRKRKKVYIELLEKKVAQLQLELVNSRKQLEVNNNSFNKLCGQSKLMNTLYSGKQQLFEKLERMLTGKIDEGEVSLLIDSLRFRLGASGKERTSAINFFFKQIIDLNVPVHMKYLLWTAAEGKDLFSTKDTTGINSVANNSAEKHELQNETTEYWQDILTRVNPTEHQKKAITKYKKRLIAQRQKFETLVSGLNTIRKSLIKEAGSLQDIIDEFRNVLTPVQTGKFLIILDKERNRKEFSSEKLWSNVFSKKSTGEDKDDDEGSEMSDNFLDDPEADPQDQIQIQEEEDSDIAINDFGDQTPSSKGGNSR